MCPFLALGRYLNVNAISLVENSVLLATSVPRTRDHAEVFLEEDV